MRNDPMLIATVLKDVDDSEEKVVPGPAGAEATFTFQWGRGTATGISDAAYYCEGFAFLIHSHYDL